MVAVIVGEIHVGVAVAVDITAVDVAHGVLAWGGLEQPVSKRKIHARISTFNFMPELTEYNTFKFQG